MKSIRTILCATVLWAGLISAGRADDLVPAIEWARDTGTAKTLDARLMKVFGLPEKDLPVFQRAFRLTRDHWVFAVNAQTNRADVFIFSTMPTQAVVWLTDEHGMLRGTASYSTNQTVMQVPGFEHQADFEKIKRFIVDRAAREMELPLDGKPIPSPRTNSPVAPPAKK